MPASLATEIAILRERNDSLFVVFKEFKAEFDERMEKLDAQIEKLEKRDDELEAMANKWKGGIAVLLALGGLAGGLIAQFDHIKAFFVKLGA